MRTKTLLLFVFLLTGMAFSQEEGTGRITFHKITLALACSSVEEMWSMLEGWGYQKINGGEFGKGSEKFRIVWSPDQSKIFYFEAFPSIERCEEIRIQALKAGLKTVRNGEDGRDIFLEGRRFSAVIRQLEYIKITRLKK